MWLVCGLCLISLFVICRAAPISRESSSNERGIYFDKSREKFANDSVCLSDDVLYKEDDDIPTASMCERCVCRPPDITCEIIKCEKKSGCRAIQRPNKCCPEYKCDCEADGRIYQNGERLENPESPCRVCYCQSGEIVCTVIKCYTREDCTPHYVTGKCCPKYDHCPPVDPTPLMFYTTPGTSSESAKSSSIGYEADITETSNISQESIQDNTVDTSKWTELSEEKSNIPMSALNTLDDYGKDISLIQTSAERSDKEKNDRDKLYKDDTEVYGESKIIGEASKTEGNYKANLQEDNTEIYTESTGTDEESTRQENDKEGVQDNIEFYTESTGTGATSKRQGNEKLELQQDTTDVYNESTSTGEMSNIEGSDKEDLQRDNTEAYIEDVGTGEIIKRQGSDKEEEKNKQKEELQQDNTKVSNESTDTGETSKTEGSNKEEMQQENTDFYTESSGIEGNDKGEVQGSTEAYTESTDTGEKSEIEGNDKGEVQGNTEAYTESTDTGERSEIEGNDKEEVQDNTAAYIENTGTVEASKMEGNDKGEIQDNSEAYTESTGIGKTSKIDRQEKEELQDKSEVYTENTGTVEASKMEGNDKGEIQDNSEAYTESTGIGKTSKIDRQEKEELQDKSEVYTENTGTGEASKVEGNDKGEIQDNSEAYTESTGIGKTSKIDRLEKEELQDKSEVYTENTGTGEASKVEGNDKGEIQDNSEAYTESTGIGKTSKIDRQEKEELQDKSEVYTENTGTGEASKVEGNDKGEIQDNSEAYTESTGIGKTSKIDRQEKEELQDKSEVYTENTGTGEASKVEGKDKGEIQDNSDAYTESTGIGKTSKIDRQEKEELQDKSEVYTENTGTGEASKMEGNDKEMQKDNIDIYAASTDTGNTSKGERNENEELQQDDTEVYVDSIGTGETRKREGNNKEELQEDGTDVFTKSTINSFPTHRSEEDKTESSSGKITNKVAETWLDETPTTPNHHILESEEAKNNDNLDEDISSVHAKKTEDNGMVKDGGAVWYIEEVRESSTETIMYETSQETEKHEITRNISEHKEVGSGTDPTQYETSVNSREGIVTGSTGGDDDIESLAGSGEIDQGKYHEDNTETGSTEKSSTTAVPDKYTQLNEHESKDTVPVVTFQSSMELHHMDLVVPGLDNTKLQVDYDINTTEENPVIGIDSKINAISEYDGVTIITNVTNISSSDDLNTSDLHEKTVHNSSEESENINKDESSTSLTISTASLTTNPTTDITSELQNTERTESSEPTTVQSETVFGTKIRFSVASLLMHDSATKTQNEEITSSTVDFTTPDVLEGEHPLNTKESERRTEQTEATVRETLQDVTAANSVIDSNNMQESKTVPHISEEGVSHTVQTSESITESDWNTAPEDETERSVYFTAGATEGSEKILGAVGAFMNNKTANTTETSDILPKEWLKTHQVTTITNPDAVHMDEDKSQTAFNHDKAEEFTSTVNYSYDESSYLYESTSGDRSDQSKETDSTTEWANESMSTTSITLENTDKVHDYPSNENDSQMSAHDLFNESRSDKKNGTDNASEEMDATAGEHGISTTNYNSYEREMPFSHNLFSQHSKKHNETEGSDTSATDIIPQGDPGFIEGGILGRPGENESWSSDAVKKSWYKQPNKFEKNYHESFSTEDKSTDDDQHGSDEPAFVKEVQSAVYSSSSYEINSHDFYGIGDYYVSSSESGLTYNMTDVHSEATSTVTSTSSEEQSTDLTTARSRDNDNEGSTAQEFANNETTTRLTESAETNRTETALESTTPGPLENVHSSGEFTKLSEIKTKNSFEDNQNAESLDTKLDENVAIWKLEQDLYESSDSHQENYST